MPGPPQLFQTALTRQFGCTHPFVAAGLAFAGETARFAAAVTKAGGIGGLGVGLTPAETLRQVIRAIRAETEGPFHVNFIACFDNEAGVRVCAEEAVPAVSFHWGLPPSRDILQLRDAGVGVWAQIGDVESARAAIGEGIEILIAQGQEAGGHNYGGLPTFVLTPTIVDAFPTVPVLAAGGISDGRGVAAALALGAAGVWVGTRLVASHEAHVHPDHHRRLLAADGADTVTSHIFGPELPHFNPMRLLRCRVVDEWNDRRADIPADRSALPVVARTPMAGQMVELNKFPLALPVPETTGDLEELPWLAGQGVGLIHDIAPAGEIVARMMEEARGIIDRLAKTGPVTEPA